MPAPRSNHRTALNAPPSPIPIPPHLHLHLALEPSLSSSSTSTGESVFIGSWRRDVQDGGGEGAGGAGHRRRRDAVLRGPAGFVGGGGACAARRDAPPRRAAGALRRRHGHHAPQLGHQRVRHRLLLRPRRLQVPGVRERALRRLLAGVGVLHRRAEAGDVVPLLGRFPPRPGVHVPDPGSGGGVGGATVPGVQRRQGGDVERGVRRLRWILPAGEDVGGHHLRLRCLLHPPLPHLLLPPLQRLRPTPAFPRQQGRRDRRLPPLIAAAAGDEEEDDHPDDHHHHDIPSY
uniref:Uncharacterized protein n=1 Tax=Oryza rufipogon TaxID=4529 RepID=A0A0E0P6R7_ORYRU